MNQSEPETSFQPTTSTVTSNVTTTTTENQTTTKNPPTIIPTSKTEITGTTRLIYLRSELADIHLSPVEKTWIIPQSSAVPGVQHVINIRSLRIYHQFPSVRTAKVLKTSGNPDVEIYPANWDAPSLANYLTYTLDSKVTFDETDLRFYFSPAITVLSGTTAHKYLGLHPGFTGSVSQSHFAANLTCPQSIYVYTDLSTATIPASGLLGIVPINVNFGELITYDNTSSDTAILCMDHTIRHITVRLTNENGSPLCPNVDLVNGYDINDDYLPNWELVLTMQTMEHPGYGSIDRSSDLAATTVQ